MLPDAIIIIGIRLQNFARARLSNDDDKVEAFALDRSDESKKQPGFISAQLHRGIGGANVFVNYAVFELLDGQSVLGISLIAGRLVVGGLIDRIFAPRVMMVVLFITAIGFVAMHQATTPLAYVLAAAGIGLALGAEMDFLAFLVSRYYTRSAFGTLFAFLFSGYALGASFGPLVFAWLNATLGSYQPGLAIFAALTALLALSTLLLPRYGRS